MSNPAIPMPDAQTFLLPARAYLLSMRDQNLLLRRAAIEDAYAAYFNWPQSTDQDCQAARIALVALMGETLQTLEDLAAFADSLYTAPEGTAFFAGLTTYNVHRANNFYAQMKKRPLDYYLHLLGFRPGPLRLEDAFIVEPPFSAEERAAIEEAHIATAKLVQRHLVNLAEEWKKWRPFANAYKHGLLVANAEDVTLVDDEGDDVDAIIVWMRRRSSAEGYGHIEAPFDEMLEYIAAMGEIALDVLTHLVDSRLRIFDLLEIKSDGTWSLQPLRGMPWQWWFDKKDISDSARMLLAARFDISFESSTAHG